MFRQEHFQFQISFFKVFMDSQNGASSNKKTDYPPDSQVLTIILSTNLRIFNLKINFLTFTWAESWVGQTGTSGNTTID